jgi:hypothetical protein
MQSDPVAVFAAFFQRERIPFILKGKGVQQDHIVGWVGIMNLKRMVFGKLLQRLFSSFIFPCRLDIRIEEIAFKVYVVFNERLIRVLKTRRTAYMKQ